MSIRDKIKKEISAALKEIGVNIPYEKISLENPAELRNGDYSTNAAKILRLIALQFSQAVPGAKFHIGDNLSWARFMQYPTTPAKVANALSERLDKKIPGIAKIEAAGGGFINFYLAPEALAESVRQATREDRWGSASLNSGKKIMVEYTDPNPFKEFHIGHLMSNAIGESIARLLQFSGATVLRANYQGDVGPHVAKAIWGKLRKPEASWGEAYVYGSSEYENHKEAIDELNKKIYEKTDEKVNQLYAEGRAQSLAHFEELYKILGTKFDHYFFESAAAPKGLDIVRAHPEVFVESDGAIVYKGEQDGLHTRVFITSKGLPTYETKELGLAELKAETADFDTSITVTAHEQSDYFAVVLAAMQRVLPALAQKIQHVSHGMMRFAEGKMSSRTGNVITGESLLAELAEAAKVRAAESRADDVDVLAREIAVAAIKYQILKQGSGKDIIFDRDRALSLEGDSGPYLQYAHARAAQLMEKAKEQNIAAKVENVEPNDLVRLLHRFPEAVEYAASHNEPHLLTNYLLEIASAFNSWYAQVHILDGTPEAAHKVALVDAVRRTLKNGLWMLGIPSPERM